MRTTKEFILLREYEFTIIASQQIPEEERKALFKKYESLILKDGGELLKKSDWGVKKLAYPIKKQFRGHYVNYDFVGRPENLQEAERLMRFDDHVLRYLSVNLNDSIDIATRKIEIAKEEAKVKAQAQIKEHI